MADFLPTRSVLKVCLPVCLLNSGEVEQLRKSKEIDRCLSREKTYVKRLVKILLLGAGESGKSTFLKQMRIIHGQDFDQQAREDFRGTIYSNVIKGNLAANGRYTRRGNKVVLLRQKCPRKTLKMDGKVSTSVEQRWAGWEDIYKQSTSAVGTPIRTVFLLKSSFWGAHSRIDITYLKFSAWLHTSQQSQIAIGKICCSTANQGMKIMEGKPTTALCWNVFLFDHSLYVQGVTK